MQFHEISCLHLLGPFTWRFCYTTTTTIYTIILIITIMIQFRLRIHKKSHFVSPLQQKWHYLQEFCILLSKQYTQFKRRLCPITFFSWKKACREAFHHWSWNFGLPLPPISLDSHQSQIKQDEILDWPHILISLKDNSSFGWIRLITVSHMPIKAEWSGAPPWF